jgi:hypothetical protein
MTPSSLDIPSGMGADAFEILSATDFGNGFRQRISATDFGNGFGQRIYGNGTGAAPAARALSGHMESRIGRGDGALKKKGS